VLRRKDLRLTTATLSQLQRLAASPAGEPHNRERQIAPLPPVALGGVLVVPRGLIDAMANVPEVVRSRDRLIGLGYPVQPRQGAPHQALGA